MRNFAKELIALQPDVVLVMATPALMAMRRITKTVPIVFVQISDPVGSGFVANMARPGGNMTGFANFEAAMGGKWLELLKRRASRNPRCYSHRGNSCKSCFLGERTGCAASVRVSLIAAEGHDPVE
jgi:putative ABC transport system substrate-binding protein